MKTIFLFQVRNPLQNKFVEQVSVVVDKLKAGSVVADYMIFINNGSDTDDQRLAIIQSALAEVANKSDGFMDPSSIKTFSTGKLRHIHNRGVDPGGGGGAGGSSPRIIFFGGQHIVLHPPPPQ